MHVTALIRAFAVFIVLLFVAGIAGLIYYVPSGGGLTVLSTPATICGVAAITAGMFGMILGIIQAVRVS